MGELPESQSLSLGPGRARAVCGRQRWGPRAGSVLLCCVRNWGPLASRAPLLMCTKEGWTSGSASLGAASSLAASGPEGEDGVGSVGSCYCITERGRQGLASRAARL